MSTINTREPGEFGDGVTVRTDITRPIMGIENRTPREVFDIMCDRIKHAQPKAPADPLPSVAEIMKLVEDYADARVDDYSDRQPPAAPPHEYLRANEQAVNDTRADIEAALSKMVECLKP